MATTAQRTHMVSLMKWLIAKEPQIDYRQARPMSTGHMFEQDLVETFDARRHIAMDCSEAVTLICRLAGLKDPNGVSYDGSGYTGTMLHHLPHYSNPRAAYIGALVVFGPGMGDHVCQVIEPGPDPLLFSHGQNAGPIPIRLSAERVYHRTPVTFLDISHL